MSGVTHMEAIDAMIRLRDLAAINPATNLTVIDEFIRRAKEGIGPMDGFVVVPTRIGLDYAKAVCNANGIATNVPLVKYDKRAAKDPT